MPQFACHLGTGRIKEAQDDQKQEQPLGVFEQELHKEPKHQRGFKVLIGKLSALSESFGHDYRSSPPTVLKHVLVQLPLDKQNRSHEC